MSTQPAITGFRRDGHLTDLALEHLLDGSALPGTAEHIEHCEACQQRLQAAQDFEAALPALPPMASVAPQPMVDAETRGANRPWMWATALTIAAVGLFVASAALQTPGREEGESFRVKGNGLTLQVFRDEGESSQRLREGDLIEPGDRLGFRVRHREGGHLMIIGVDDLDEPYLCYPQTLDGSPVYREGSTEPRALPEAIRMDATKGSELLVAVLCDEPHTYDTLSSALLEDRLPEGCVADRVELDKR